jgi:putative acetyltransferase
MSLEVRPARAADVAQVVRLVRDVLTEFGIEFGNGCDTDTQLEGLPDSYTRDGGAFFVAVEGDVVLGTAGVSPLREGVFELRKMYLRPATRGQRLGQRLFDACLSHVRAHEGTQVVLDTTDKMTSAIAFYGRNGFVRDDAQRRASRCSRGYRLDLR